MEIKKIIDALNGKTRRRARVKTAVGTSVGVLAGAVAGIMLTPDTGRKIKKVIKNGTEHSTDTLSAAAGKPAKFAMNDIASAEDTVAEKGNNLITHLKHAKKHRKMHHKKNKRGR